MASCLSLVRYSSNRNYLIKVPSNILNMFLHPILTSEDQTLHSMTTSKAQYEDLLKEKMEFLSKKLDAFAQALDNSRIEIEPGDSDLDILVKIEKILREMEE